MSKSVDMSEIILPLGLVDEISDFERAIIAEAIVKAEGIVLRYLEFSPVLESRTEYYPLSDLGTGTELQLKHIPVRSVTSLHVDPNAMGGDAAGAWPASTEKVLGVDFFCTNDKLDSSLAKVCSDGMLRMHSNWSTIPSSIEIVYTAGFSPAELRGQDDSLDASPVHDVIVSEAIRHVRKCITMKSRTVVGLPSGPVVSESMGDFSYQTDSDLAAQMFAVNWDLLPSSQQRLGPFLNYGW